MMTSSKQTSDSIMMRQGLIRNSRKNRVTAQTLGFSGERHLFAITFLLHVLYNKDFKEQPLQEISKVTPTFINTLFTHSRCYMICDDAMATIANRMCKIDPRIQCPHYSLYSTMQLLLPFFFP